MTALHALRYTGHDGRSVIRLVPGQLTDAEDLALASVGVVPDQVSGPTADGRTADRDLVVGTTVVRAVGFPAWPIITDPDNARHALNLVGDLEWARRVAASRAGDVKKRFDLLTAGLTASAPHFVPTLLEELSRIFADAGNTVYARQYFGRARETERSHNVPVDPDRHRAMFTEFAGAGIVGAREMTAEASASLERFGDPADALAHVLDIMGALTDAGNGPYAGMARDVRKVAKAAGVGAADADGKLLDVVLTGRGFTRATGGFLTALKKSLPAYLTVHPGAAEHFANNRPGEIPVERFLGILDDCGYLRRVRDTPGYPAWLVGIVTADPYGLRSVAPRLQEEIRRTPGIADLPPTALTIPALHPALIEELLTAGLDIDLSPESTGGRGEYRRVNIRHWYQEPVGDLAAIAAHPVLGPTVLEPGDDNTQIREHLGELLAHEGTRTLLAAHVRQLATVRATLTGALPTLGFAVDTVFTPLADPRIADLVPDAVEALFGFDAAEELAAALRQGLLVEFTWPEFEDAYARARQHAADWVAGHSASTFYGAPSDGVWVTPTYPDVALIGGEYIEVIGPRGVIYAGTGPFGGARIRGVYTVGDTGVVVYQDGSTWTTYHWWFGDAAASTAASGYRLPTVGTPIPAGRLLGSGVLVQGGDVPTQGDGTVLDLPDGYLPDGELLTVTDWGDTWRRVDRRTGENLGTVTPDPGAPGGLLDRVVSGMVAATGGAGIDGGAGDADLPRTDFIDWDSSFILPLPEGFTEVPTGSVDGRQVVLRFRETRYGSTGTVLTPLGIARSDGACDAFVLGRASGVLLALPGGGLVADNGLTTVSPVTGAALASSVTAEGSRHCLHRLPDQLWYALVPRDPDLSRRLRGAGAGWAQELLDVVHGMPVPGKRGVPTVPRDHRYRGEEAFATVAPTAAMRDAVSAFVGAGAEGPAGTVDPAGTLTAAVADVVLSVVVLDRELARLRDLVHAADAPAPAPVGTPADSVATGTAVPTGAALTEAGAQAITRANYAPGEGQITDTARRLALWVNAGDQGFRDPEEDDDGRYHSFQGDGHLAAYMGREKLLLARFSSTLTVGVEGEDPGNAVDFLRGLVAAGVLGGDWDTVSIALPDDDRLRATLCSQTAGWVDLGAKVHPVRRYNNLSVQPGAPLKVMVRRADRDRLTVGVLADSARPQDHLTGDDLLAELDRVVGQGDATSTVDAAQATQLAGATGLSTATCRMLLGGVRSGQLIGTELRKRYGLGVRELDLATNQIDALKWATPGLLPDLVAGSVDGPDPAEGMASAWRDLTAGARRPLTLTDEEWLTVNAVTSGWQNATAILTRMLLLDGVAENSGIGYPAVSVPAILAVIADLSLADPRRPAFADLLVEIRAAAQDYAAHRDNAKCIGSMDIGCPVDDPAFTDQVTPASQVVRVPLEGHLDELTEDLRTVHPDRPGAVTDPANSVPDLVGEVESTLSLNPDAARYFLQILALALPTDANVRAWNGWKKKDIDAAGAELLAAGLVVQARRSGAGRSHFLPGGWLEGRGGAEAAKPLEVWKAPLYLMWADAKARPVLAGCPPHVPVPALFRAAWQRYRAGDVPGYEDLSTTRYRSRRR